MQKDNHSPKVEKMINIIKELQQAQKISDEELRKRQAEKETLKKELDELHVEETHLKEILSMKQETLYVLQQHYREQEKKRLRQRAISQDCIRRIEDLNSHIEEEKLRRRKQRMEFGQHLEELMEKHKALWELHTPERLTQEINNMASSKEQLLKEEMLILEKLESIEKQLAGLPHPQARTEALAADSESSFLCSEEATVATYLFEEENKKALQYLEAAFQHYHQLQLKYHRLKMELEAGGQEPKGNIMEATDEGASGVVTEGALGEPVEQPPWAWKKEQNIDLSPEKHPTGQASFSS
ncbi:synaptonemal complex central element protein 1-like [Macrotis lagotis]|uniref:synaptonemal complex central element protein 1-like n=1 Tax=Macrotis lagotis TaxID=92651 RepID=UPI003D68C37E